jgi:hypothetical protein
MEGQGRRISALHPTTEKISIKVSMDVKMEVWWGSVLLENEVLTIFL